VEKQRLESLAIGEPLKTFKSTQKIIEIIKSSSLE